MTDTGLCSALDVVDVVALGESMITFLPSQPGRLADVPSFERGIGGAESNVACGLAAAGHSVRWVSRVGADGFGDHLVAAIGAYGVDVSAVRRDPVRPTGVYFRTAGDRAGDAHEVAYYRAGSAASAMAAENMDLAAVRAGRVLHLSGITAALSDDCFGLLWQLTAPRPKRPLVSFDVNFRPGLWRDADGPRVLLDLARRADLVFVGADEAEAAWGITGGPEAIRAVLPEPRVLVVKDGARGATAFERGVVDDGQPGLRSEAVDGGRSGGQPANADAARSVRRPADADAARSVPLPVDADAARSVRQPVDVDAARSVRQPLDADPTRSRPLPADADAARSVRRPVDADAARSLRQPVDVDAARSVRQPLDADPTRSRPLPADADAARSVRRPADADAARSLRQPADADAARSVRQPLDADATRSRPLPVGSRAAGAGPGPQRADTPSAPGCTTRPQPAPAPGAALSHPTGAAPTPGRDESSAAFVPALHVEVVAAVGAGDAFAAGFLSATLRALPLRDRLRHGHLWAAAALTAPGDLAAPPSRDHADRLAALDDPAWEKLRLGPGWTQATERADEEVRTP